MLAGREILGHVLLLRAEIWVAVGNVSTRPKSQGHCDDNLGKESKAVDAGPILALDK